MGNLRMAHLAAPSDRQAVLVVKRRIHHLDQNFACRQKAVGHVLEVNAVLFAVAFERLARKCLAFHVLEHRKGPLNRKHA